VVFAPALSNGFVEWDDRMNFTENPHFRGLGAVQLRWMFTSAVGGHWTPVTWLTLGLDYVLWGMNPFGYHLTALLLHVANAAAFYLVASRLLALALPAASTGAVRLGAVTAALLFAFHPLRAESVAWITERRDLVSGLFYFLTLLAYLAMVERAGTARRRWYLAALGCFTLALLSKSIVVSLPFALLVLDVYPLRRLGGAQGWLTPAGRRVLLEKVPFVLLVLATVALTTVTMQAASRVTSLERYPPAARVGMVGYSLAFYVWKTAVPAALSPVYELPWRVELRDPAFLASTLAVAAITIACVLARRRWPAGAAVWIVYALTVAPISGVVHTGPQLVADRYSYLSTLGLALLLGGGLVVLMMQAAARAVRPALVTLVVAAVGAWTLGLAAMTWGQVQVWRSEETLWQHALAVDPDCGMCNKAWAEQQARTGEPERGLRQALAADVHDLDARTRLGAVLLQQGRRADAEVELRRAVGEAPESAEALTLLGLTLSESGRPAEAIPYLQRAVSLAPSAPLPRFALGRALQALDRDAEARPHVDALQRLEPRLAERLRRRL
jgi:protein O-mannosyl-transferase